MLRLVSAGIDLVILLTLHFVLCSTHFLANDELEDLCGLLPYVFLATYEIGLGTSIGKQFLGLKVHFEYPGLRYRVYRATLKYSCLPIIVYPSMMFTARRQGLHEKAAKSVVVHPNGWTAWARASIGVLLSAYAMLTFGCGQLVGTLMAEKYNGRLVNRQPELWVPGEARSDGWHRLWVQGGSLELPTELEGLPLRGTPFVYFYGGSRGRALERGAILVLLGSDSHPIVELCKGTASVMRWLLSCEAPPRAFQTAIFTSTTETRFFLSPKSLLRENAMRLAKSFLLEGDELVSFRSHDGPDFSVVWHAIARVNEEGNIESVTDYVHFGGDEPGEQYSVSIIWNGHERQEALVASIASSFTFDRGTEAIAESLLEQGRRRRSSLPLLSAIEVAKDKLPAAELIYALYARDGLDFERRQFANWVGYRVEEGDLRFMDLNERVWDWRADEEDKKAE